MENKFIITEINRVAMVGKNEYPEEVTSFSSNLFLNELIFHFSGRSTIYFDDLVFEIVPNTIRFLPKGNAKRYDVFRHERGETIFVCFQTDRPVAPSAFICDARQNEKIGALFKKMFSTWVGRNNGYYFNTMSLLYKIFAEIQNENYVPSAHYHKIKPAIDMIHDCFLREDATVASLSRACGIGESYFQRLFKEKYGISPKKYMIQLRLNHACELLQMERYSVTEIASLSGFSDVYFFSRQFKERMGITPTEFIKKYKSSK